MKKFKVAEGVIVEALGPNESETPLVFIKFEDYPDGVQAIPIFSVEIRDLVKALQDAACWIADQVRGEPCVNSK